MKFCLNIEDYTSMNYRLQSDNTWRSCDDNRVIQKGDFVTQERDEILALQVENQKITIDNVEFTIANTDGVFFNDMLDLSYAVYGFRDEYPNPPERNQMEKILLEGDDKTDNILLLKTDGIFHLVSPDEIIEKRDPEIVAQFECFQAGTKYVGTSIKENESDFENYILEYFTTAIHYWRNHLVRKLMHEHIDIHEGETTDDLLDIYIELKSIKNSYNK